MKDKEFQKSHFHSGSKRFWQPIAYTGVRWLIQGMTTLVRGMEALGDYIQTVKADAIYVIHHITPAPPPPSRTPHPRRRQKLSRNWQQQNPLFPLLLAIGITFWEINQLTIVGQEVMKFVFYELDWRDDPGSWNHLGIAGILALIPVGLLLLKGKETNPAPDHTLPTKPGELPRPPGYKGLIIWTNSVERALISIRYHYLQQGTLEQVWLLSLDQTELPDYHHSNNLEVLQHACQHLCADKPGVPGLMITQLPPIAISHLQAISAQIDHIYEQSGYASHDVIIDLTGTPQALTIHLLITASQQGRNLEYTSEQLDGPYLLPLLTVDG